MDRRSPQLSFSTRSIGRLLAPALACGVAGGCTALTKIDRIECQVDSDCSHYGPGIACVADGYCDVPEGDCISHSDCPEFSICRRSDRQCTPLLTNECLEVVGDYKNDNSFLVGLISPLRGDDEGTGLSILNGFKMGLQDIEVTVNGLPPLDSDGERRPMAAVACSDDADTATALRAAEYLVDEVQVPAIVGAAYSGITIEITTEVTQPGGVFTFSPSATSIAITDLADDGLLWRTSPSDRLQAEALAKFMSLLEAQIRTDLALLDTDDIGFALLNKDDAYGSGLALAFESQLEINGGSALADTDNYTRFNYGNPDDEAQSPTDLPGAVALVLDREPHVVAIMGTAESFDLMEQIEAGWNDNAPRPQYLLADAGVNARLWDEVIGSDDGLRRRVQGSIPGVDSSDPAFNAFRTSFNAEFNDGISSAETFGAAGAYDIAYMLFYTAATIDTLPIRGADLAGAMSRLVGGEPSLVGRNQISTALQVLAGGSDLDFTGASGPLDFDLSTGEAPSDIQIWCVPIDTDGNATATVLSGIAFSAATRELSGTAFGEDCDRN